MAIIDSRVRIAVDKFVGRLNAGKDSQFGEQRGKSRWEMLRILLGGLELPQPEYGSQARAELERVYEQAIIEKEEPVITNAVRALDSVEGIVGLSKEGRVELIRLMTNRLGLYLSDLKPQERLD